MSENEIQMVLGEMRVGFARVERAIETSRQERQTQVAELHKRVSDLTKNGCALRPVHEAQVAELQKQLHDERSLKHDRDVRDGDGSGEISWTKKYATGVPAIIVACAIALSIVIGSVYWVVKYERDYHQEGKKTEVTNMR